MRAHRPPAADHPPGVVSDRVRLDAARQPAAGAPAAAPVMIRRRPIDPGTARLLAAVASESRPYTDPGARYPTAADYQHSIAEGVARRRQAAA
ncbi:hypothetical protein [Paractinoplanes atraurantiacus]|nr:hypothetical protein [Actinoplanes atraurantiacus]